MPESSVTASNSWAVRDRTNNRRAEASKPQSSIDIGFVLLGGNRGLIDLLLALRILLGANLDRAAPLDLYVLGTRVDLLDGHLVLGVAGVGRALDPHALVGVIARAGHRERLVNAAALGLL